MSPRRVSGVLLLEITTGTSVPCCLKWSEHSLLRTHNFQGGQLRTRVPTFVFSLDTPGRYPPRYMVESWRQLGLGLTSDRLVCTNTPPNDDH